jgi:hypothetical protein
MKEEVMRNALTPERRALATAILVIAFVAALLFFTPAHADARVLVCSTKDKVCTEYTARIVFIVPADNRIPTACLSAAQTKTAEVAAMIGSDERVRIECERK